MTEPTVTTTTIEAAQPHPTGCTPPTPIKRTPEEHARLLALHNSYPLIWLTPTISLGPWLPTDRETLVEYLNDARIHSYLCGPPFPYTLQDADLWLGMKVDRMSEKGTPLDFCFRDWSRGGKAVGSIAVSNESDDVLTGDDTGYWLAPEYHGQGLMSKAVRLLLHRISMVEVGKRKFNAHAFIGNYASRRILEKTGFVVQEGEEWEKTIVKNGKEIRMWVLRLTVSDEDVEKWELVEEAKPLDSLVGK
ncbi:acyl-CoA N-acyltransferase [Linnemannia elongata AG-77]|uniref:Acyl-CoA N-acyltransferase n=1 Tax=Linnemannia elongata AG-77 TaxID=1314771 RepID=A0A197JUQ3_9FUNG|nr:acyl-CoA N-acyltransferase [Linnemannia elongata AG-77]